jgi:penicillin-insensitive murein DD-endopeptidase
VRAIEEAAAAVEDQMPGGAELVVGDLSARHGGKIPGHRSHRTGRDVDFLWYFTTPGGAPVRAPGFVHVESDGLAFIPGRADKSYVRLDVERQWLLIKHLVTSEHIGVQFMFASRDVEALLIDYARARGEPPELVWHAQTVLLQPGDSTPHADHVHLRIACTPDEAARGCLGGGPYWRWLPSFPSVSPVDTPTLRQIAEDDPFGLEGAMAGVAWHRVGGV